MLFWRRISAVLSQPILLNYVMPILMVYLIVGTVAQKYIGLYEATRLFFSSPILWLGSIPLPGLPILLFLIFINLAFKLFKGAWTLHNAGTTVIHIGVMLLLLGGLFTALLSHEGYIDFAPGEQKSFVSDYHIRELVLLDEQGKAVQVFDHLSLAEGDQLSIPGLPLTLTILETCQHCEISKRDSTSKTHHGMAQHMMLSNAPLQKEDEENMAGVTFAVEGGDQDGVYLVLENVLQIPRITSDDQSYQFVLRRQRRDLPFTVELIEFKRDMHPGTSLAKSYQSRVRILDGGAQWESVISMNEPLRYKGYTLFQSSFVETPQGDVSVLAVVWNVGRVFPYIYGIAMCLGMIIHLVMRRKQWKQDR